LLALADKLDTLQGCFRVGLVPTGSRDPFALRRAAQGVVKILVEGKLGLPLAKLLGKDPALAEFFLDRVKHYFREVRGFAYDEVNAVWPPDGTTSPAWRAGWRRFRRCAPPRTSNRWRPASSASRTS